MDSNKIKKLIQSIKNKGLWIAIKEVLLYIERCYWNYRENKIDREYGIKTGGVEKDYLISMEHSNLKDAEFYEPIRKSHFNAMLEVMEINYKQNIFIDLGAGKGRALIFAAEKPFKQIMGVEFSNYLFDSLQNNIKKFLAHTGEKNKFQLFCMDAADFEFPNSDIIVYLFNPFTGRVMERVLEEIDRFLKQSEYEVIIMYRNPVCSSMFVKPYLNLVVEAKLFNIYKGIK